MPSDRSVEKHLLLTAQRFRVERVKYPLADGTQFERDIVRHPGAVVIVPVLDDGRICLIENYRVAVERTLLELPAGTMEPPEPEIETAGRELVEETGYRCSDIQQIAEFYMSPGILDERMVAFVATGLIEGENQLERGEQISNCPLSTDEVDAKLRSGEIQDAKTISTLLLYLRYHRGQ